MKLSEKDLLMMYHTEIRNIGLYTSISLAALAYSRSYRGKGPMRNVAGIIVAIGILLIAMSINFYLYKDLENYMKEINSEIMVKWVQLLPFIGFIQLASLGLNIYTLYKQLTNF